VTERPRICSRIGVNHHIHSKHSKENKPRSQCTTYLLSKYLAVISNSSHATHAIVAARPWSLEGEFAFFEKVNKKFRAVLCGGTALNFCGDVSALALGRDTDYPDSGFS